jgi:uncharacterized protein (TIGR04255 family)
VKAEQFVTDTSFASTNSLTMLQLRLLIESQNDEKSAGKISESMDHNSDHNDLFFPDSPRVIYDNSPLVEVVCQITYPTILKIDAELPADFQEEIRGVFPKYERGNVPNLPNLPRELANMFGGVHRGNTYTFRSNDTKRFVTLNQDSIALTFQNYKNKEEFFSVLNSVKSIFEKIYRPAIYNRIGLRYQNAVRFQNLPEGSFWTDLLSENIVGELASGFVKNLNVDELFRMIRFRSKLNSDGVFLQHGLAMLAPSNEQVYLIDIDCYTNESIEVKNASSSFDRLNRRAGRAFRWCISDTYHNALGPKPVGEI